MGGLPEMLGAPPCCAQLMLHLSTVAVHVHVQCTGTTPWLPGVNEHAHYMYLMVACADAKSACIKTEANFTELLRQENLLNTKCLPCLLYMYLTSTCTCTCTCIYPNGGCLVPTYMFNGN